MRNTLTAKTINKLDEASRNLKAARHILGNVLQILYFQEEAAKRKTVRKSLDKVHKIS